MITMKTVFIKYLLLMICLQVLVPMTNADPYVEARADMMATIRKHVTETIGYTGKAALSARVMAWMATVPRHQFVPQRQRPFAYLNQPLPIGEGQTISQPYIVALMTDMLDPQANDTVLEVGTGSGYQAAVLSGLVKRIYSIEIVPELARSAAQTLKAQGYDNVIVKQGDGYQGWPEHAPFDGIIVTAGGSIPPKLVEQLKPGGSMVIPVDDKYGAQTLMLLTKDEKGEVTLQGELPVRFVPLINEGDK